MVAHVQAFHGLSERRCCVALGVDRSSIRYRSVRPDQTPLRLRIRDLSQTRVRYGYFRIYILLRREGWLVNHKRVYRLYREDGLSLRLKRPRRNVSAAGRERQPAAGAPNELWSMDFVSDALFDGRRLRALTVVDAYTREALTIEVDHGIKGEQVVDAVTRIAMRRSAPRTIRVDNGPEFVSKALDRWAYENAVTLDFSRPGDVARVDPGGTVVSLPRPAFRLAARGVHYQSSEQRNRHHSAYQAVGKAHRPLRQRPLCPQTWGGLCSSKGSGAQE